MAYYLGRDLDFALTTEHATKGLVVQESSTTGIQGVEIRNWADSLAAAVSYDESDDRANLFAGPKKLINDTFFGNLTLNINPSDATAADEKWDNRPDNMTGVDISLSTMDEDVQFIGQRNILKAEIKKENSVTLTRKKKDNVWNVCFNEARFGINEDGDGLADGRQQPDYTGYGFRVYLKFATGTSGETFILPNCCITDYTTSMSPDATQEESITLMSYVDPIILDGADTTEQVADAAGGL